MTIARMKTFLAQSVRLFTWTGLTSLFFLCFISLAYSDTLVIDEDWETGTVDPVVWTGSASVSEGVGYEGSRGLNGSVNSVMQFDPADGLRFRWRMKSTDPQRHGGKIVDSLGGDFTTLNFYARLYADSVEMVFHAWKLPYSPRLEHLSFYAPGPFWTQVEMVVHKDGNISFWADDCLVLVTDATREFPILPRIQLIGPVDDLSLIHI